MKTILVTIKEFLENGGTLLKDREIYTIGDVMVGSYFGYDSKLNSHLMYNAIYKSTPISETFCVRINTKPIYL